MIAASLSNRIEEDLLESADDDAEALENADVYGSQYDEDDASDLF